MPGMLDVSLFNDVGAVITQHYATPSDGVINRWRFYGTDRELSPEEKLCHAIIIDAVRGFRGDHGHVLHQEAKRWITDTDREGFSFDYCCEALNVNPSYLRKRLLSGARQLKPPHKSHGKGGLKRSVEARAKAMDLMLNPELTINNIAKEVGLASHTVREEARRRFGHEWVKARGRATLQMRGRPRKAVA
jgi:hypothetical protein